MTRLAVLVLAVLLPLRAASQTQDLPAGTVETIPDSVVIAPVAPADSTLPVFGAPVADTQITEAPVLRTPLAETPPAPPPVVVSPPVETPMPSADGGVSALKQQVMNFLLGLDVKITALEERVAALNTAPALTALTARIEALEAGGGSAPADPGPLDKRLADLETRLAALEAGQTPVPRPVGPVTPPDLSAQVDVLVAQALEEQRPALIEALWQAMQGAVIEPRPEPGPAAPFVAEVDANGSLISFNKSALTAENIAGMLDAADCAEAGAWFDATYDQTDYRAFFVTATDGIKECSKSASGWKVLRAENSTRAHLLKRGG